MASQGIDDFIWFIAVLSDGGPGLLNLFPIPVLDGGHLLFHAYEAVAGKPPLGQGAAGVHDRWADAVAVADAGFALTNDISAPEQSVPSAFGVRRIPTRSPRDP